MAKTVSDADGSDVVLYHIDKQRIFIRSGNPSGLMMLSLF
jgi:hypothetical protein